MRVGSRRVPIRRSDLNEFLERQEAAATAPAVAPATDAFGTALRDAAAGLDGTTEDLAAALRVLAKAARVLADALDAERVTRPDAGPPPV